MTIDLQLGAGQSLAMRTAGDVEISAERRVITVLAVDVVKSTRHIAGLDPEDAQLFLDQCFRRICNAVERTGGTLVSYEGDGGVAAFGWPEPHEDHADRALAAAWHLQYSSEPQIGPVGDTVELRLGLDAGLVAVRELNQNGRRRLNAVGTPVHLAAKLQQLTPPGQIYATERVMRLARKVPDVAGLSLDFENASLIGPAVRLRGLTGPSQSPESARAVPPIGREPELDRLRAFLASIRRADRIYGLVGEAGVGKSRLASAAKAIGERNGARSLVVYGDARKASTSFAIAREVVRTFEEPPHGLSESARADRRGATSSQVAQELAVACAALHPDQPVLLVIEDLQLVDAESRDFLFRLVQARPDDAPPVRLLLTARPEGLPELRALGAGIIDVRPLTQAAMAQLADQLLADRTVDQAVVKRLVARADGLPLVLEELVRSLGEDGTSAELLPDGVASLVHARLQRLEPGARALAQTIGLLGEDESPGFFEAVLETSAEEVARSWKELERFGFVQPAGGTARRLRHQIIAEACADTVSRARRRLLHRRAIEAVERQGEAVTGQHERLASYAVGAGDQLLALQYLCRAAAEARRDGAAASINALFDRAIGLAEPLGEAADERYVDVVLLAFASLLQLGEFEKMRRHLPRVLAIVRKEGRPHRIAGALSQLGMLHWFEGRYADGLAAAEEGLRIARVLGAPALIYSNWLMFNTNLNGAGEVLRAVTEQRSLCAMLVGDMADARLGAAGLPSATAAAFLAWFLCDVGAYEEAFTHAERALQLAKRANDPYGEILAGSGLGRVLPRLDRDADAADRLSAAWATSERHGYDAIAANFAGRLASSLARVGKIDDALRIIERCLEDGLHLRTGQLERFYMLMGHAETLLRSGASAPGLDRLNEAAGLARDISAPVLLIEALSLRASFLTNVDAVAAASCAIERDEIARHFGIVPWATNVAWPRGATAAA